MRPSLSRSAFAFASLVAWCASAAAQTAAAQSCAAEDTALRAHFAQWRVGEVVPQMLRVGDKVTLSFPAPVGLSVPVYLVVATPDQVRFEGRYRTVKPPRKSKDDDDDTQHLIGPGFIAVPPGIIAPDRVEQTKDRMRVLAPLHHRGLPGYELPDMRTIGIEPLKAGPFALEWVLVAKSACGERAIAAPQRRELTVRLGRPEFVVQDLTAVVADAPAPVQANAKSPPANDVKGAKAKLPAAQAKAQPKGDAPTARPQSIITSNSGAYVLRVFRDRYEVLDAATGTRLIERPGYLPNFSPTSRFVAARTGGTRETNAALEIIDLSAGRTILNISGPTLAWSHGDSMLVAGQSELQSLAFAMPLIDRTPPQHEHQGPRPHAMGASGSGREADAWNNVSVHTNYATGNVLLYSGDIAMIANLFDGVGRLYGDTLSLFGIKQPGTFAQAIAAATRRPGFRLPWGWSGDAPLQVGNRCVICDSKESRSDFDGDKPSPLVDGSRPRPFQKDLLVAHRQGGGVQPRPLQPSTSSQPKVASVAPSIRARAEWSPASGSRRPTVNASDLSARLAEFGLPLAAHSVLAPQVFKSDGNLKDYWGEYPKPLMARLKPALKGADWENAFIAGQWTIKLADRSLNVIQQGRAPLFGWESDHLFAVVYEERAGGRIDNVRLLPDLLGNANAEKDTPRRDGFIAEKHWTSETVRLRVTQHTSGAVVIGAPAIDRIALLDPATLSVKLIEPIRDAELMTHAALTQDGRTVVQINQDGRFFAYDVATSKLVVSGRHADGELIMHDDNGYFTGTYEGAHFLHLRFPGEPGLHSFNQFQSRLHRPDIIAAALKGQGKAPPPDLAIPPTVEMQLVATEAGPRARITARSGEALRSVRLYQDGQLTQEISATGRDWSGVVPVTRLGGARWITAIAVDGKGLNSQPAVAPLSAPSADAATGGTLRGVLVGIDEYDHAAYKPLVVAARDARDMAVALTANAGRYYGGVALKPLADAEALPGRVLSEVEQAVNAAVPGDTVVLFFAGHGARDGDGNLYLATTGSNPDTLKESAIPWAALAATLRRSKARVIVMLDACHSGAAGEAAFASNDAAAAEIMSGASAPVLVLAASKGRQLSLEDASLGNGFFTRAMKAALGAGRKLADTNGNGVLEISELYRAVKADVVRATNGRQTPWLARSDLIGDFAVF